MARYHHYHGMRDDVGVVRHDEGSHTQWNLLLRLLRTMEIALRSPNHWQDEQLQLYMWELVTIWYNFGIEDNWYNLQSIYLHLTIQ